MRIAVGADHAGFEMKDALVGQLRQAGHQVEDFGTSGHESVDYPDFGKRVGEAVAGGDAECGVLVCGTGIGIGIAANKIQGIRCAMCSDILSARMAREHNDANVIAVGARVIGMGVASEIVREFLTTDFAGGRHARRVDKIEASGRKS